MPSSESVYASRAKVGERYTTKAGFNVTVVQVGVLKWGKPAIVVEIDESGDKVSLDHGTLLWPRGAIKLNKENEAMAKNVKSAKEAKATERASNRGVRKEDGKIVLFREWKGKVREAMLLGHQLVYDNKEFGSIREVVEAITGKKLSATGKSFFGLRKPENKKLCGEIVAALKDSIEPKKEAKPKAARKAKKAVVEDDDEDDKAPKSVADVVAKVMGKGRR